MTNSARRAMIADLLRGSMLGFGIGLLCARLGLGYYINLADALVPLPFAVAGAVVFLSRWRNVLWYLAGIGMVAYVLVAFTPVIERPGRWFIRADRLDASQPPPAIAILSGGVNDDGLLNQQGLDRVLTGIEVARRWGVHDIIISRVRPIHAAEGVTSEPDQRALIRLADSTMRIHVVDAVGSTRDEATTMTAVARRNSWNSVFLVTSPFHTRRACGTFEAAGLRVTCVPARSRDVAVQALSSPDDRLRAFSLGLYEALGMIKYRARGWL